MFKILKCQSCKKPIAENVVVCLQCGHTGNNGQGAGKEAKKKEREDAIKAAVVLIFITILIAINSCGKKNTTENNMKTTQQVETEQKANEDIKVREYKIIKVEDSSIKALDKPLSSYSTEDLAKVPTNIRKTYFILLPSDVTKEEFVNTVKKMIKTETTKDNDIDLIMVFAYDKLEDIKEPYTVGRMIWGPKGEWSGVTSKIALNNDRSSYNYSYDFFAKQQIFSSGTIVKLINDSGDISVSSKSDSWEDNYIIVSVPNGTEAKVLDIAKYPAAQVVRYKVVFNYLGKEYTGWVHDFNIN